MSAKDDAIVCLAIVEAFWQALNEDDDQAVRNLVLPAVVNRVAQIDRAVAARFREALELSQELAARIGTSTTVRRLTEDRYLIKSIEGMRDRLRIVGMNGPELIHAWVWVLVNVDGRWQMWGTMSDEESLPITVEYIDVSDSVELPGTPPTVN